MKKTAPVEKNYRILRRYTLVITLLWTLVLIGLALFNYFDHLHFVKLSLISQARDTFNKDLVLRRWVASHGGVYVPPDSQTPPNPYLSHLPRRDVVTKAGQPLTLMNPAYVMRQVYDLGREQFGLRAHITSLKPLRPENAPDPWERKALEAFARGVPEVVEEAMLEGQPFMRLMRPLFVEKRCLKCHAVQGYKIGDLRGGTSVSIAMRPVMRFHKEHLRNIFIGYLILWLAGLIFIYVSFQRNRKRIFKAEQKSRYLRRLATLVEQTHSAIMIVALDGKIEFVNHGYELLSGYSKAELLGCDPRELLAADKMREQRDALWQAVKAGQRWRGVTASRHKNGTTVYEDAAAFPILDAEGKTVNYAVIKHDITDLHSLQDQLLQVQKMEAVGTLASGLAHDFNNILTVINSFSEILIDECDPDSPILPDLVEINEAGQRAAELTRQLLAFSRSQIIQPREVCLRRLIENLMKMMRRLLSEDIELEFMLPAVDEPVKIMVDPVQIEQVLINLLVNARDALKNAVRDKKIILRLTRAQLDARFVRQHPGSCPGDFALIEVEDNGCGMDQEAQRRCFEPFYTTKELGLGIGLGLSMIYGIVKQNEGYVSIISEIDRGTTIQIYWPLLLEKDLEAE